MTNIVKTLALSSTDYGIYYIDFKQLILYQWLKYKENKKTGVEIYYIQLLDSNEKNTLGTQIMKNDIYGNILFIKTTKSKVDNINEVDMPEIVDVCLNSNIEKMSLTTSDDKNTDSTKKQDSDDDMESDYMDYFDQIDKHYGGYDSY